MLCLILHYYFKNKHKTRKKEGNTWENRNDKRIMCLEEERMQEGEKSREMVERKEEGGKKD